MKNRRYFVSYAYKDKFGNSLFGNAAFTNDRIGFDFQEELKKKDPELKGVVILFFKELRSGEFEDAK